MTMYQGGCHCRRIVFEVSASEHLTVYDCNCSICHQSGFLHLIVNTSDFRLLSGETAFTVYRFNTGTAKHQFCATCGIKSFYIPRSHPNGYSVNARCLDEVDINKIDVRPFDGKNWESSVDDFRHNI